MRVETVAAYANVLALLPAGYSAYGTWVLLHPSPSMQNTPQIIWGQGVSFHTVLFSLLLAVGLVFSAAILNIISSLRGRQTAESPSSSITADFLSPRWQLVSNHKFENENIDVDGKSFRSCHFKNTRFSFHGTAPAEFTGNSQFEGNIILSTDHQPTMFWRVLEHIFSTIPGAEVETYPLDKSGHRVERKVDASARGVSEHRKPDATVKDSDPKIYIEFKDDRWLPTDTFTRKEDTVRFVLTNRGLAYGKFVCLHHIQLREQIIEFSELAQSLPPRESIAFNPVIKHRDARKTYDHDIFLALFEEWDALNNQNISELIVPISTTYQDDAWNLYESTCDLVFDVFEHRKVRMKGQQGNTKVVDTRNHRFRKVAIATTALTD